MGAGCICKLQIPNPSIGGLLSWGWWLKCFNIVNMLQLVLSNENKLIQFILHKEGLNNYAKNRPIHV